MKADGRRVAQFEKRVQELVAQYLIRGFKTPLEGLVTVSRVKMPSDLRSARIYVSVYGINEASSKEFSEEIIGTLNERAFEVQSYLSKEMKTRYCPKIHFEWDKSLNRTLDLERKLEEMSRERDESRSSSN